MITAIPIRITTHNMVGTRYIASAFHLAPLSLGRGVGCEAVCSYDYVGVTFAGFTNR